MESLVFSNSDDVEDAFCASFVDCFKGITAQNNDVFEVMCKKKAQEKYTYTVEEVLVYANGAMMATVEAHLRCSEKLIEKAFIAWIQFPSAIFVREDQNIIAFTTSEINLISVKENLFRRITKNENKVREEILSVRGAKRKSFMPPVAFPDLYSKEYHETTMSNILLQTVYQFDLDLENDFVPVHGGIALFEEEVSHGGLEEGVRVDGVIAVCEKEAGIGHLEEALNLDINIVRSAEKTEETKKEQIQLEKVPITIKKRKITAIIESEEEKRKSKKPRENAKGKKKSASKLKKKQKIKM